MIAVLAALFVGGPPEPVRPLSVERTLLVVSGQRKEPIVLRVGDCLQVVPTVMPAVEPFKSAEVVPVVGGDQVVVPIGQVLVVRAPTATLKSLLIPQVFFLAHREGECDITFRLTKGEEKAALGNSYHVVVRGQEDR